VWREFKSKYNIRDGDEIDGGGVRILFISEMGFFQGLIPNLFAYNVLINSLCKEGKLEEAKSNFKKMKEKGLSPNDVTYSILIDFFSKSGKLDVALLFFHKMVEEGV
ncbi:Pentatricopeptide repeat-containing protein, partial [Thalictrum thalictroides]